MLGWAVSSGCLSSPGCPAFALPVSNFSTCTTFSIFGRAGGSSRGVLYSTVATRVLLLLLLLLLWFVLFLGRSFPWGSLVDCVDSLGAAKAHGFHLTIDCDVGPANLLHLGCCLLDGQSEELLHQISVIQDLDKLGLYISLLLVLGWEIAVISQCP